MFVLHYLNVRIFLMIDINKMIPLKTYITPLTLVMAGWLVYFLLLNSGLSDMTLLAIKVSIISLLTIPLYRLLKN